MPSSPSGYQTLYRKYRPQRFSELVGQTHVATALRNSVREGRVGHAYLFSGPRGTGKTTTARLLAKALNCTNLGDDGDPCGACESCVAIADGTSLDVIEVDAASKSRVEEMRELLERVAYSSAGGRKKVYILDEVHMLSASAEAALLKTLEESPEHVVFVLATTDPLKVAPTIRSRTQHFEFTLYTVDEIAAHLARVCEAERITAAADALDVIARAGSGSMRDSLSLLDQAIAHGSLDVTSVESLFGRSPTAARVAVLEAIGNEDVAGALIALSEQLTAGHEPRRLTEDLLATARDAFLLVHARGRVRIDAPEHEAEQLAQLGEQLGGAGLVRVLETLGQAMVDMRGTDAADPRLVLEIAIVRLARRDAGPPLQALAERVERLERGDTMAAAQSPSPGARSAKSFAELRRERGVAADATVARASADPGPLLTDEPAPAVDIDDVILAWAAILPDLPPATRAAVREAQPLAVDNDVITFGVPKTHYEAALPRFKKEADNIRAALSERLGRRMKFRPIAHDGFDAPATRPSSSDLAADEPVGEPPDDDDFDFDPADDASAGSSQAPPDAAVDSLSLITGSFDATIVEEVPRD